MYSSALEIIIKLWQVKDCLKTCVTIKLTGTVSLILDPITSLLFDVKEHSFQGAFI